MDAHATAPGKHRTQIARDAGSKCRNVACLRPDHERPDGDTRRRRSDPAFGGRHERGLPDHVDLRVRLLAIVTRQIRPGGPRHPNHPKPRLDPLCHAELCQLSNRVLAAPDLESRHRVDNQHSFAEGVAIFEITPANDRDSDRAQIVGTDKRVAPERLLARGAS